MAQIYVWQDNGRLVMAFSDREAIDRYLKEDGSLWISSQDGGVIKLAVSDIDGPIKMGSISRVALRE